MATANTPLEKFTAFMNTLGTPYPAPRFLQAQIEAADVAHREALSALNAKYGPFGRAPLAESMPVFRLADRVVALRHRAIEIEAAETDSATCANAYEHVFRNGSLEDLQEVALIGQEADNHLGDLLRAEGLPLFKC